MALILCWNVQEIVVYYSIQCGNDEVDFLDESFEVDIILPVFNKVI
jgi:hypothetical protein